MKITVQSFSKEQSEAQIWEPAAHRSHVPAGQWQRLVSLLIYEQILPHWLLLRLNESTTVKCLVQCLVPSRHHAGISIAYSRVPSDPESPWLDSSLLWPGALAAPGRDNRLLLSSCSPPSQPGYVERNLQMKGGW